TPDGPGRETALRAQPGQEYDFSDCRDLAQRPFPGIRHVSANFDTWFDLDCNYCTGVANYAERHWAESHPPPNPALRLVPEDHRVLLQWDNSSEYTPDPDRHTFDFRGYRVWKASNWKRPGGQIGPDETLWELLGTFYYYDALHPLVEKSVAGTGETLTVKTADVLGNRTWAPRKPLPRVIHARSGACIPQPPETPAPDSPSRPDEEPCSYVTADMHVVGATGLDSVITDYRVHKYVIGRWQLEDPQVLNGFTYFYSITAFDSSG